MDANPQLLAGATDAPTRPPGTHVIHLSQVVSSLSCALDMTEGQPEGHSMRTCLIGMRIAQALNLSATDQSDLFYALLLKDLGCSSNATDVCQFLDADDRTVKKNLKLIDWSNSVQSFRYLASNMSPQAGSFKRTLMIAKRILTATSAGQAFVKKRCDRGAEIARSLGLSQATAETIRNLDEHFDGHGHPMGIAGESIPLLARIASIAQTTEVFIREQGLESAKQMAEERRGRWFDPKLVDVFLELVRDNAFLQSLEGDGVPEAVCLIEPEDRAILADEECLDCIADGFARVVDAKSPWTFRHSTGVAEYAVGIAIEMGFEGDKLRQLRRGAVLHDIGKLGISSLVLDKPGPLTDDERRQMKLHPVLGEKILERVPPFHDLAEWASAHHERLDGKGYPAGIVDSQICLETRILTVADICQAVTEERPYRPAQPIEKALKILHGDTGTAVDGKCVEALVAYLKRKGV